MTGPVIQIKNAMLLAVVHLMPSIFIGFLDFIRTVYAVAAGKRGFNEFFGLYLAGQFGISHRYGIDFGERFVLNVAFIEPNTDSQKEKVSAKPESDESVTDRSIGMIHFKTRLE